MKEKSVVFPAPFGPARPMRSWRFTCSDTSANNVRPPNALLSPQIVSIRSAGCCAGAREAASSIPMEVFLRAGRWTKCGAGVPPAGFGGVPPPEAEELPGETPGQLAGEDACATLSTALAGRVNAALPYQALRERPIPSQPLLNLFLKPVVKEP